MQNQVVILTLVNGMQFIGRCISNDDSSFIIRNPKAIQYIEDRDSHRLVFVSYFSTFTKEDEITFYKQSLLYKPIIATDELEKGYVKTTSGLELIRG